MATPEFIEKLISIIKVPKPITQHHTQLIHWNKDGTEFEIVNRERFEKEIL